ncbi:helicase [Cutibacterium acnes JCM 18918]|nr:helicase [Cutibacterium acnes JCM 18918]
MLDQAGDDQFKRYRLLPTELAEQKNFRDFWRSAATGRFRRRLSAKSVTASPSTLSSSLACRAGTGVPWNRPVRSASR